EGELVPSTTFMFALVLVGGIAAAMLTQVIASTIADRIHRKRLVTWAFTLGQYMFAIGASGLVYRLIAGGVSHRTFNATQVVAALVAGGALYAVKNGEAAACIAA